MSELGQPHSPEPEARSTGWRFAVWNGRLMYRLALCACVAGVLAGVVVIYILPGALLRRTGVSSAAWWSGVLAQSIVLALFYRPACALCRAIESWVWDGGSETTPFGRGVLGAITVCVGALGLLTVADVLRLLLRAGLEFLEASTGVRS